ncbi:MAG: carboxypeptidase regulatory-like domain-containing protein [Deltaproteobacteria bacterium]
MLVASGLLFACSAKGRAEAPPGTGGTAGSGPDIPVLTTVGGLLLPEDPDGDNGGLGTGPCVNLQCQQAACSGGARTTLTGTVFTPSGELPLYNVTVYVPNKELEPISDGASCSTCDASVSGSPVVAGLTDTAGHFRLENVPAGDNVPLVMQVGKWRRKVMLPHVEPCAENALSDVNLTRLPANQSEGDLPRIALSTGALDALECLLRKVGISDSEFTNPEGTGRVNLFAGHQGTQSYDGSASGGLPFPTSGASLWDQLASFQRYDVVLLSCEGDEFLNEKPAPARQALFDYLNGGGRAFLSHWHKVWLQEGPAPFPDMVRFNDRDDDLNVSATVDTSFPKGAALAEWLVNVNGSTLPGSVDLVDAQNTAATENPLYAQRWIYDPMDGATGGLSVKYVSANTPLDVPSEQQCGRTVYSDIHVSSGDNSAPARPFPTGCTSLGLSPQEKVLIYMLFDLSACIVPDDQPPAPPIIVR